MKTHLHEEQFDGWLHPQCATVDSAQPGTVRAKFFVADLEEVPYEQRCRHCARHWWPRGGEPGSRRPADLMLAKENPAP